MAGRESRILVVALVQCESQLPDVILTLCSRGRRTRLLNGRQNEADQYRDDSQYDEQFDERDGRAPPHDPLGGQSDVPDTPTV